MTTSLRPTAFATLAACVFLTTLASACNSDEPATYLPEPGEWLYTPKTVVSNSCDADLVPDPLMTFLLDYDGGDSFQIELGDEDVVCEIDGADFSCSNYVWSTGVPGFSAIVQWSRTWEGEFSSETEVSGNEITRVTCSGDDCPKIDALPCSVNTTFEASAI